MLSRSGKTSAGLGHAGRHSRLVQRRLHLRMFFVRLKQARREQCRLQHHLTSMLFIGLDDTFFSHFCDLGSYPPEVHKKTPFSNALPGPLSHARPPIRPNRTSANNNPATMETPQGWQGHLCADLKLRPLLEKNSQSKDSLPVHTSHHTYP